MGTAKAETGKKSEKRRKPKTRVINTHKSMAKVIHGGLCACCMKHLKGTQIDHFSSGAWDEYMITG